MTDYMTQYKRNEKAKNNSGKGTPQPGEIWWALDLDGIKDRPVLILGHNGNTYTFRKCTSQTGTVVKRDMIEDYTAAGLDKPTYVDPEKRSIGRNRLAWKVGELSEYDRDKFGL